MEDGQRFKGEFPVDALESVCLKLHNPADLCRFSLVSKYWYKHVRSNLFWKMQPASSHQLFCCLDKNHLRWFRPSLESTKEEPRLLTRPPWEGEFKTGLDCKNVSHYSFSYGLLCLCFSDNDTYYLHIYDPFRLDEPKDLLDPMNVLYPEEVIGGLCFNVDSSSGNYSLILALYHLGLSILSIVFYDSSTRRWKRSNSFEGNFLLYSKTANETDCIDLCSIRNSLYFQEKLSDSNSDGSNIVRYHIPTQTWSKRWFDIDDLLGPREYIHDLKLTQSKGKLMLVGLTINQIYVWHVRAHKEIRRYTFRLLSKLALDSTCLVKHVKYEHDLICIYLIGGGWETKETILIFSHSKKRWQHVDIPSNRHSCFFFTKAYRILAP